MRKTSAQPQPPQPSASIAPAKPIVDVESTCLADVEPERVDWLWDGRIPFGKLTVIEGHPGVGKSTLTLEIAARVSRGDALPGSGPIAQGNVLLVTAEDGLSDTVRPRLDAADANVFKIHALGELHYAGGTAKEFTIPEDVPALEQYVVANFIRLVVIDPLNAYLAGEVNAHRDQDVRRALKSLSKMAERTGCALVVVRHLTKVTSGAAILAGGGSIGIAGAARSVMLAAADPETPSTGVLAVVKNNLARKPESLRYELVACESGWHRLEWIGISPHNAEDLISAGRDQDDVGPTNDAKSLLSDWLQSGPMAKEEVVRLGVAARIAVRTLERAAEKMKLVRRKTGFGASSKMTWALPDSPSENGIRPYTSPTGEHEAGADSTSRRDNGLAYSPAESGSVASMDFTREEETRYLALQARLGKTP